MKLMLGVAVFLLLWGWTSSNPPPCVDEGCSIQVDSSIHPQSDVDPQDVKNHSKRNVFSYFVKSLKNGTQYIGRKLHIINKRNAKESIGQQSKECPKCKVKGEVDANIVDSKTRSEREINENISISNLEKPHSHPSVASLSNDKKLAPPEEKDKPSAYFDEPQIFYFMEKETQGTEEIIGTEQATVHQHDDLTIESKSKEIVKPITLKKYVTDKSKSLIDNKTTKGPLQVGESETSQTPKVAENVFTNPQSTIKDKELDVKGSQVKKDTAVKKFKEVKKTKDVDTIKDITTALGSTKEKGLDSKGISKMKLAEKNVNAIIDKSKPLNNEKTTEGSLQVGEIITANTQSNIKNKELDGKGSPKEKGDTAVKEVEEVTKTMDLDSTKYIPKAQAIIKDKETYVKESSKVKRDTEVKEVKEGKKTKAVDITKDLPTTQGTIKDKELHAKGSSKIKRDTAVEEVKKVQKSNTVDSKKGIPTTQATIKDKEADVKGSSKVKRDTEVKEVKEVEKTKAVDVTKDLSTTQGTIKDKELDAKGSSKVKRDTAGEEVKEAQKTKAVDGKKDIPPAQSTIKDKESDVKGSSKVKRDTEEKEVKEVKETKAVDSTKDISNAQGTIKDEETDAKGSSKVKRDTEVKEVKEVEKTTAVDITKDISTTQGTIKDKELDVKGSSKVKRDTVVEKVKEAKKTKAVDSTKDIPTAQGTIKEKESDIKGSSKVKRDTEEKGVEQVKETKDVDSTKDIPNAQGTNKDKETDAKGSSKVKRHTEVKEVKKVEKTTAVDIKKDISTTQGTIKEKESDIKGSSKVKRDTAGKDVKEVKKTKTVDDTKDIPNPQVTIKGKKSDVKRFSKLKRGTKRRTKSRKTRKPIIKNDFKNKDDSHNIHYKRYTRALMGTEIISNKNFGPEVPQIDSQMVTGRKLLTVLRITNKESDQNIDIPKIKSEMKDSSLHKIDINGTHYNLEVKDLQNNKSTEINHIECACALYFEGIAHHKSPVISEFMLEPIELCSSVNLEEMLCSRVCSKISDIYFKEEKLTLCSQIKNFHHKLQFNMPIKHTSKEDNGQDTILCQVLPKAKSERPPWEYIISYMHIIFIDILVCMTSMGLICLYLICFFGYKKEKMKNRWSIPVYTRNATATLRIQK